MLLDAGKQVDMCRGGRAGRRVSLLYSCTPSSIPEGSSQSFGLALSEAPCCSALCEAPVYVQTVNNLESNAAWVQLHSVGTIQNHLACDDRIEAGCLDQVGQAQGRGRAAAGVDEHDSKLQQRQQQGREEERQPVTDPARARTPCAAA